jgi:uncharacterized protein
MVFCKFCFLIVVLIIVGGCSKKASNGNVKGDKRLVKNRVIKNSKKPSKGGVKSKGKKNSVPSIVNPVVIKPSGKSLPVGVKDKGVFSKFDSLVSIKLTSVVKPQGTSILINKAKRIMVLYYDGIAVKVYPIALSSVAKGSKIRSGDKKTPEGKYYICERLEKNLAPRYGARSLRISYPGIGDAKRGLKSKLINKKQHDSIVKSIKAKKIPHQRTTLGSSIRIHGGGVGNDWTLGCIAMRDDDVIEVYNHTLKTSVTIVPKVTPNDKDKDGIPDQVDILMGAIKLTHNKSDYDPAYFNMKYPNGDPPAGKGVCTDVLIRAMRNAGYDLQSLIHEDIVKNRALYKGIKKPDWKIDHRRVRNVIIYFKRFFKLLDKGVTMSNRKTYMPGDVVFLDTLPRKGPDHMGVVADELGKNGYPIIINNWTTGYVTSKMELLPSVTVTHHFRINK